MAERKIPQFINSSSTIVSSSPTDPRIPQVRKEAADFLRKYLADLQNRLLPGGEFSVVHIKELKAALDAYLAAGGPASGPPPNILQRYQDDYNFTQTEARTNINQRYAELLAISEIMDYAATLGAIRLKGEPTINLILHFRDEFSVRIERKIEEALNAMRNPF